MRAQRPLSDAHLAEAVRRGVITTDQMEALLALARSDAAPGSAAPDLRWTHVVLGVASAVAVLVPGLTLLSGGPEHRELALAGECAVALVLCALAGRFVRARGWGRAPAAILTTGAAPYAGGVALSLAFLALGPGVSNRQGFSGIAVGLLVATGVAIGIWRARRVGPALGLVGFLVPFATPVAARLVRPDGEATPYRVAIVVTAVACLALAALRPSWGRRDGVDGRSWWELGAFAAAAFIVTIGLSEGLVAVAVWAPAALGVGLIGLWARRWTYQLAGLLGVLWFLCRGLASEPALTKAASLVGVALLVAAATQWQRRRELREVVPRESLSYWE